MESSNPRVENWQVAFTMEIAELPNFQENLKAQSADLDGFKESSREVTGRRRTYHTPYSILTSTKVAAGDITPLLFHISQAVSPLPRPRPTDAPSLPDSPLLP